jgi:heme/copper-type cytochrome/quinol oxidase subunit 3
MALATPAPELSGPAQVRRVNMTGTIVTIAAASVLMGGLLASYFQARQATLEAETSWAPINSDFPNAALGVTYLALLLSSFTAQWAVSSIKVRERRFAYIAFGLTFVLGAAFVNGLTFCWHQFGQVAGDDVFANHMYAVTATHLVLVLAAAVYLLVVAFRVIGGQFGPQNTGVVMSAVAFWHFVVFAGVVVYWCIWFLPGGP